MMGMQKKFDDMLARLRLSARIFAGCSLAVLIVTFALLFYIQRPIDDVATVATWSPFEVEVWFRRQNVHVAYAIATGGNDEGYIDGAQLTMLSLNDLRRMYRHDGHEDVAVDVYHALEDKLRKLSPITIWFVITVMIQTGFIYGILFFITLICGVRWVKKKVDANPMVQQMKMLTGMTPVPPSGPVDSNALVNPMMGGMGGMGMMNPMLNPFGPMMAMQNASIAAAAAMAQSNTNGTATTDDDDPTSVVDGAFGRAAAAGGDPTAMMMANPFLFSPFGPPPPGLLGATTPSGTNGTTANGGLPGMNGMAGMPPMFPFMPPPPGLVARAAARRKAQAAATNWQPDLD